MQQAGKRIGGEGLDYFGYQRRRQENAGGAATKWL